MAEAGANDRSVNGVIWAVFWRFTLISFVASIAVGFMVGVVITLVWKMGSGGAATPDWVSVTNSVAGGVAGLVVSYFVLRWVILNRVGKDVGGARLMLTDTERGEAVR